MINILGDIWFEDDSDTSREPDWSKILCIPEVKLHLYGKTEARRARKMGHITIVAETLDKALLSAEQVRAVLGIHN